LGFSDKKGVNKALGDQLKKGAIAYDKPSKILEDLMNEFEVKYKRH